MLDAILNENGSLSVTLKNLTDTDRLAKVLADCLVPGIAVLLNGDLGVGKTTLIRSICAELGWPGAKSPSFSLVNEYELSRIPIAHADLYRLKNVDGRDFGFDDYISEGWILFVEWPDRLSSEDFGDVWHCSFIQSGEIRRLTVSASGQGAILALKKAVEALK